MTHRPAPALRLLGAAPLALLLGAAPAARAAEVSPCERGAQSEARLIGAGVEERSLLAGVEVRLQPRFITYWRDPGDAGVPPTFSFAGSANLRSAAVRYPAPARLDEAGATAFGYAGDVVFPILVEPLDPAKPVGLAVRLDYAACHDICLPAHADLRLTLDGEPSLEADRVREALAAVPRPTAVGAAAAPAILAVTPGAGGAFGVEAALPEGGGSLFVEAPEGWAYAVGAPAPAGPGRALFPVKQVEAPKGEARPPAPLTLTLATPAGAVEAAATLGDASAPLDGAAAKP